MTEYEKGFEDGKAWLRNEIATNPIALFDLLPSMAGNIQEQINAAKLSPAQNQIIQDALAGKMSHAEMITQLHNTIKDAEKD